MASIAICSIPSLVHAQSFALMSNDNYGSPQIMYMDDEAYPMTKLDTEQMRVLYTCELSFMEGKDKKIKMDCYLQIGEEWSKYVSWNRFNADSLLLLGGKQSLGRAKIYDKKADFLFVEDCYYTHLTDGKIIFTGRLAADDFLYEEDSPKLQWTITESTRQIGGYRCQLAKTSFRGREYRAWFTEEIPISSGPWKFQGLPGLILQVEDSEKVVKIQAVSIDAGSKDIIKTAYPFIRVSRTQYAELRKQMLQNPILFCANHSSRSGWKVQITDPTAIRTLPMVQFLEKQ